MANVRLVPINEYPWTEDYSWLRTLTCINHPTARYLTKNPYHRGIHFITRPEGDIERNDMGECKCIFGDLAVVVEPGSKEAEDLVEHPNKDVTTEYQLVNGKVMKRLPFASGWVPYETA